MLKLRESQLAALKVLTQPGRHFGALWAEPRSGKSAVILKWLSHIPVGVALIVGPKIAEATWRSEAAKWLTIHYRFFSLTAGNKYPNLIQVTDKDYLTILFVNYEQFGKAPYKRLKPFIHKVFKSVTGAMVLDESHMIKTPNSVTGKNIRPLAAIAPYRLIATGTPVTNPSQVDAIYGQWTFLDPSIRDKWPTAADFRDHFGEWNTFKGFPELVRPRHQAELHAYLAPHVVTLASAASPIPMHLVRYPVPSQVLHWHQQLLQDGVATPIPGHTVAALNPLTRLLRMRTLVAGWVSDDTGLEMTIEPAATPRLKALSHIMRKYCSGKMIIACTHLWEIHLLRGWLKHTGVPYIQITGETNGKDAAIETFQRDPDARVLLVQPRTVAMAVDISVAEDLIWYSADFNYVTFKQTSDRIKLSPANPQVWFLCARGTVDYDVWIQLTKDHDHLQNLVQKILTRGLRSR